MSTAQLSATKVNSTSKARDLPRNSGTVKTSGQLHILHFTHSRSPAKNEIKNKHNKNH